ncbi:MAG: class I SAM-dependent methyltransferase [Phycisphaerae bacterium]
MKRPWAPFFVVWYCCDVVRDVLKRCEIPLAGRSVLEIGCGGGSMLFRLCRDVRQITGLDVSNSTIEFLREHYAGWYPNVELIARDIGDFDAREKYDLVISNDCFEHVADQESFLANAARCLKPGGTLCLQFPNQPTHGVRHHRNLGALRRLVEPEFAPARYFAVEPSWWHRALHGMFSWLRGKASARYERIRRAVLDDPETHGLDDFSRSACFSYMREEVAGGLKYKIARAVNGAFRVLDRVPPRHRLVELTHLENDQPILELRLVVLASRKDRDAGGEVGI